jgi:dihydrodipicolinate synthase/N-acetylneuraminate lyase
VICQSIETGTGETGRVTTSHVEPYTALALTGIIPILPTPFTPTGAVDDEGFTRVIDTTIADGVDGICMFGLASEYYKLSDAERTQLVQLLVRHANERCPVIVSIVPHSTHLAVAEAVRAVEAGVDALLVLPPFFLAPSLDSIAQHIEAIASAVPVPVIVQYAPLQTGRTIDAQVFAQMHRRQENISHVKVDMVPSGPMISTLRLQGLQSLVGYMGLHLPEDFSRGVGGVMPTVSVCPLFVKLWRLLSEDPKEARLLHQQILPLLNFMMQSIEFLLASEKELLIRRGILSSSYRREPTIFLDSSQLEELDMLASHLGI